MTDLRARISGVVLNRLADYGIRIDREIADSVAAAVLAVPAVSVVDLESPEARVLGSVEVMDRHVRRSTGGEVTNERELATLSRRVRYASKVIQEATQRDPLFDAVYHSSLNHDGVGLCGILHDLHDRLYAKEMQRPKWADDDA